MRETQYDLSNVTLSALEIGTPSSLPSIILLHGWLDNAASFASVLTSCAKRAPERHFCALDLAGHGHSTHKGKGYYYPFHDYIDDIYQLITSFFPQKCILVGHSLGALIAACYSSTFPEQVTGLLQIEGVAPLAEQSDRAVQRLREGIISREQVRSQVTRGYASFAAALRHRAQVNRLGPELIQPVVERGLVERDGRWFWRHDRQLQTQSAYRMPSEQSSTFIQGIRCPYCLILGCDGYTDLPQTAAVLLSKQCTILTIVGGHHCHLEQPEYVAQTILEYID
ncbi:MAG: alpha/beta fold hydrolase [Vibrio sp.]